MDEEYYRKQINGLLLILEDQNNITIGRSYMKEKLTMILNGGIGFHPHIKKILDKEQGEL